MAGGLNFRIELGGNWRRMEKKFSEIEVADYISAAFDDIGYYLETELKRAYDDEHGSYSPTGHTSYTGGMREGILYDGDKGRVTLRVGLFAYNERELAYFRSVLYGWSGKNLSREILENRIMPWVRHTFGVQDPRQVKAIAVGVVRSWADREVIKDKNFLAKVFKLAVPRSSLPTNVGNIRGFSAVLHKHYADVSLRKLQRHMARMRKDLIGT